MNRLLNTLFLISLFGGLNACSSNRSASSNLNSTTNSAKAITAIELSSIQPLALITPKLAQHRTVFVGEMHTQYGDHLNQLAVIKNLHNIWGGNTSIGLEMIQQPYQDTLDDYIDGKISERDMLHKTQWFDRWQYDFRLYRPIFNYAKENKIPLVALNIPKELTKRITKDGIKGLTKAERKQLPAHIDRSNTNYTKRIKDVFNSHMRTSSKSFDNFLDAQLAWDEGMAFAAAKYLQKNPTHKMILLAGGGHIINREGIPGRLDRQIRSVSAVVLNHTKGVPNAKQGDYLLYSPETKLPPIGLIGIHMKPDNNDKGVIVAALSVHGAAKKAGVKKNDLIINLNNHSINALVDVRLAVENKRPGDKIVLKLKRQNKIISIPVKLGSRLTGRMPKFHKTPGKKP